MNKILLPCMISAFCLIFSGCGQPVKDASKTPEKNVETTEVIFAEEQDSTESESKYEITFPAHTAEKTEYNAQIFEITPFTTEISLPKGWTVKQAGEEGLYLDGLLASTLYIYDTNNDCVGAMGYTVFEQYEETDNIPMAIYNQISLGNGYQFNVSDTYTVVASTDAGETALVDVNYSASHLNNPDYPDGKVNKGILSYDKDKLVYIAFEFEDSAVSEEMCTEIAKSITIK